MKQDSYLKDNWPVQLINEKNQFFYKFSSGMDVDHWETSNSFSTQTKGRQATVTS